VCESAQSWKELLLDLKRRGLAVMPKLAVADGAPGFWQAIEEVWPQTRGQRCWVHKTADVLNKLPKSQQSKAKRAPQEIWMAETKKDALAAFDIFVETWGVKLTIRPSDLPILSAIGSTSPRETSRKIPRFACFSSITRTDGASKSGAERVSSKVMRN
jgi:hypothetical protein